MKDIREKIRGLTASYTDQLNLYRQIQEKGSQEPKLIAQGHFASLLEVLQEKGRLLEQAGIHEAEITAAQDYLVQHFRLNSFSLPKLKMAAAPHCRQELAALETAIAELVPILEALEEQERNNEALLDQYLEQPKGSGSRQLSAQRAAKAYGKKKRK